MTDERRYELEWSLARFLQDYCRDATHVGMQHTSFYRDAAVTWLNKNFPHSPPLDERDMSVAEATVTYL